MRAYPDTLSPVEHRVLVLAAAGLPSKRIAYQLRRSDDTIRKHLSSAMHKLGAGNRTGAVVEALRRGWLSFEEVGR